MTKLATARESASARSQGNVANDVPVVQWCRA
jgi:hypothetical protein